MNTTTTTETTTTASDLRNFAERAAESLEAALGQGCTATALCLAGSWYVVTSGTGEGYDYAYDADDVDPEDVSREPVRDEEGEMVGGWDYTSWCSSVTPCEDLDIAVEYYMREGGILGTAGSCRPVLSDEQIRVLAIARRAA